MKWKSAENVDANLFQFGEVVPGVQMADDGVCYVYGCDDHPDRCKGFVDSH